MELVLPAAMEDFVQAKVSEGAYESPAEVIQEGLRLLQEQEDWSKSRLNKRIDAGLSSLNAGLGISAEEYRRQMDEFRAEWKRARGLA